MKKAAKKTIKKTAPVYVHDQVFRSALTDRYFFVRRAKVRGDGVFEVIRKKYDVTESVKALIQEGVDEALKKKKKGTRR